MNHKHGESCQNGIYDAILQRQSTEREDKVIEYGYFLNLQKMLKRE